MLHKLTTFFNTHRTGAILTSVGISVCMFIVAYIFILPLLFPQMRIDFTTYKPVGGEITNPELHLSDIPSIYVYYKFNLENQPIEIRQSKGSLPKCPTSIDCWQHNSPKGVTCFFEYGYRSTPEGHPAYNAQCSKNGTVIDLYMGTSNQDILPEDLVGTFVDSLKPSSIDNLSLRRN